MTIELWGTFSVRDHLAPRAFVADVLLYDRVVIPTFPEGGDPASWSPKWELPRQQVLLEELGDLAIQIPWTQERHDQWQARFDADQAKERAGARGEAAAWIQQDAGFQSTRMLLSDYANHVVDDALVRRLTALRKARPGSELEAVTAYPSYDDFEHDVPVAPTAPPSSALSPTQVFGWEFFVPEDASDDRETDVKLLKKAIKLAQTAEFIELRSFFYGFWKDVTNAELPAEDVRAEMERRYAEYRKIMLKQEWKSRGRFAIKVADVVTGGLTEVVRGAVTTTAETMFGSADLVGEKLLADKPVTPSMKAAALFHDARRRLGWKPPRD